MKTCPTRNDLSDLLDRALSLPKQLSIRLHARSCAACALILAEEHALRAAARNYGAASPTPARLRSAVLTPLAQESIAARRRSGRAAKTATVAILTAALALIGVFQWRSPGHGQLAYAAVEDSMRQIRTATWNEHTTCYKVATWETTRWLERMSARMDPPALRREQHMDLDTVPAIIMKPESLTIERYKEYSVYNAQEFFSVEKNPVPTPTAVVRREILRKLMAPTHLGSGRYIWHCHKVTRDGRALWRFDRATIWRVDNGKRHRVNAEIGPSVEQSQIPDKRLTAMGWRDTLWVDPDTRRVVRSIHEDYDGDTHIVTIADGFVYDRPLSDKLFQTNNSH